MKKESKQIWLITAIVLCLSILCCIAICSYLSIAFHKQIMDYNSYTVGNLVSKYPEFKEDIIDSFLKEENYDLGFSIVNQYDLSYRLSFYQPMLIGTILVVVMATLLIGGICVFFIHKYLKKINEIDDYMNQVLNGDYTLNIKDYNEGEISNLKNNVYKMTIKLKEQSDLLLQDKIYLEETLEDISHQIKTPLTSMYMITDILSGEIDEKTKKEFLSKNQNQLERLEWLITSLLKMSRLDSGSVKLKKEKVNITELINKSIEPIQVMIELKNIDVQYHLINKEIEVDKNWTSEALLNIIKNGCEHTKDKLMISSHTNPLYTSITIEDNGNGISKTDLPHIFERFYKGSHNKDSIGIGLNMSKKIIGMQNGEIEVETKEGKGTKFIIKFYKCII